MNVFVRRPVVTAIVAAFAALIVVDAARRAVERHARTEHSWPMLVLLAVVVYGVAVFAYFSSDAGQTKLAQSRNSPETAPLLLALAIVPVIIAVPAVFLGAATWALWAAFAITCGLLAWWTEQHRRPRAR